MYNQRRGVREDVTLFYLQYFAVRNIIANLASRIQKHHSYGT